MLGVSTSLVSTLIRADDRIKAEENYLALNSRTAQTIETAFENIKSNTYFLFEAFYAVNDSKQKAALAQSFFRSNQDVLFVSSEETGLLFNPSYEQFPQAVKDFLETPELKNVINSTSSQTNHKTAYFNSEKIFDTPSVVFVYKYGPSNSLHTGIVGFDVQFLTELMSTGSNNASLLADSNAHILINPDFQ